MTKLIKIGRYGSRNLYLAPDGKTALRFRDAKAAHKRHAALLAERDDEIAYSMATGWGDHAKIARLDAAISQDATSAFPTGSHIAQQRCRVTIYPIGGFYNGVQF